MSRYHIRPAKHGDLPQVAAIYADAVSNGTASYELEPPTLAEMTARFDAILSGEYPYLVATDGEAVLGYAYASAFRTRPAYRFVAENSVYVAPQAKGTGVGKALMVALIEECKRLGFRQILAVIGDGSEHSASVRLHERLGFRHAGRLEATGYKHGRWLDTVLMQLPMNGGGDTAPDPASMPERRFRAGRL
ncbi:GNAT family N-acetyltransferase [Arvimicrobium flavum]|uniref:GNAT family N-acetyltransferase n=1 Tax=Arvimicrobium flavum TaxID=3393320 RepID=UPI00237BB60C|nr:GNAT family N-acetyltransferase [Mesorhizobium shangrilense]